MFNAWQLQFKTSLGPGIWAALLAVPLCIILLYFLKLRRQPVVVSSTLLWRRSMEDLRVNSLFQRLRRNILLILQLLMVCLLLVALAGPKWGGSKALSTRLIIAIDNSASMSATDVKPDRLSLAKSKALNLIDRMSSNDLAMVIAFSDSAEVISSYSSNKNTLRQKINAITPTQRKSDLREALQVADGLANPSRQMDGVVATAESTPKLYIFTDGGFEDVQGFSLGNLEPELVVIGQGPPDYKTGQNVDVLSFPAKNVAILALQARRNEDKTNIIEVFGRIKNYDSSDANTELKLYRLATNNSESPKTLIDALKLSISGETERGFQFTIADTGPQAIMLESSLEDDLLADNVAFAAIAPDRKPKIQLVTKGNRYLSQFFRSPGIRDVVEFSEITPDDLNSPEIQNEMRLGNLSLIIFDNCSPPEDSPQANCIYFGAFPPEKKFETLKTHESPVILDWDSTHPVMQYLRDLSLIKIRNVRIPEPLPASVRPLVESDKGPIVIAAPREGFTDIIVGFALSDEKSFNTDWFLKYSFPLFLTNSLSFLAGLDGNANGTHHAPGSSFSIVTQGLGNTSLNVKSLDGLAETSNTITADSSGRASITTSSSQGVFSVNQNEKLIDLFAVDLFNARESDLSTRGLAPLGAPGPIAEKYQIKIGFTPVTGKGNTSGIDSPLWKIAALFGLLVLIVEWFVYNRRVAI